MTSSSLYVRLSCRPLAPRVSKVVFQTISVDIYQGKGTIQSAGYNQIYRISRVLTITYFRDAFMSTSLPWRNKAQAGSHVRF